MNFASFLALAVAVAATQTLATYRVQNRLAAEMVSIAEAALGGDGSVVLDARTATLILNGSKDAVDRTLALLERMDRPLRTVVVTHEIRELAELEGLSVAVTWRATVGALRLGTLPLSVDGIRIALSAGRESHVVRSRALLRLLEGGSGTLVTGDALPFVYLPYPGATDVSFVAAETGLEATAAILGAPGDEKVALDIRPFSGRFEEGGRQRYTAASTSIVVSPGETVVIGEASRDDSARSADLQEVSKSRAREERILLVSVEIEKP